MGLYKAEPLQNTKRSYGSNFFYTSSQMWEPSFFPLLWMGDEMYHVKHPTPTVLGKFDAVSVYIPDQLRLTLRAREFQLDGGLCVGTDYRRADLQMFLRAATFAVHLVRRCLHISSPAVGIPGGASFYLSKDLWCIFSHMALHFLLF